MSTTPSIDDFIEALSEEPDWYSLGIFLGVPAIRLDLFKLVNRETSVTRCLIEVYMCLERLGKAPSWDMILLTLRSMGNHALAKTIVSRYIDYSPPEGIVAGQPIEYRIVHSVDETILSDKKEKDPIAKEESFITAVDDTVISDKKEKDPIAKEESFITAVDDTVISDKKEKDPIAKEESFITAVDDTVISDPEPHDVYQLLKSKSSEWHAIGRVLGVSFSFRQELRRTLEYTDADRLEQVIHKWLQSKWSLPTWDYLIEALERLRWRDVAEDVTQFLTTDQVAIRKYNWKRYAVVDDSFIATVDDTILSTSNDDFNALLHTANISVNDWHSLGRALGLDGLMFSSDSKGAIISQWLHNGDASWRALVRALSSPFVGKRSLARRIAAKHPKSMAPSSSLPSSSEPVTDEKEYHAEYVKAMAEGGGDLKHLNVVLHGPPGSGKSSLKGAILGEDPLPEDKQNSTDILENTVRAVSMDRLKSFKVITNEDFVEFLAKAMLDRIKKVEESRESTDADIGNQPLANLSAIESNKIIQRIDVHDEQLLDERLLNEDRRVRDISPTNASASNGSSSSESVSSTLSKIRDMLRNGKFSSDLFNSTWHHLIDSGGQFQYKDIFPLLYNSPSFQIVLMRLIDGLDKKLPNCYTVKGENALKNQHLQLTNRQYIEKMCQIAASAVPPSKVMIVGTHKDKLGDDAEAKIKELNQALKDIKEKYGEVLIYKSDDQIIFDINTMAKGEERKEYTQKLQEIISEVSDELATSTPAPLQWLAFHLDISKGNGVVEMEYCNKSGKAVGMKVAAIESALVYLNKAALLLYYPKDIPDIVLTSVDPLVSKLSQLVKASFITPKRTLRTECEKLRNTGIFNLEFLKHVPEDPPSALSNDLFLKLLLCLRIADYVGNDDYFLPSALSLDLPCEKLPYTCSSCVPVGFVWKDSDYNDRFLPHGFFFTVAVEFLGASNHFVFKLSAKRQCRQEIRFEEKSNKIPGIVALTDRNTWIQVSTTSRPEYCPNIFKSAEIAIHKAMVRFKRTTTPKVVSLCSIHPNSNHYCTPSRDKKYVTCSEDASKTAEVTPDMLCWLPENQRSTVSEESFITAVDDSELSALSDSGGLVAVLEAVHDVVNWQYLGLKLGLEKPQLDIIDQNKQGIVGKCQMEMISQWLDTGNASWRALVRALASPLVGKRGLAMKIAAEHRCS